MVPARLWWCSSNAPPSDLWARKNKATEIGTKWELFDRHLLVTAALFQTEKENARESQNVNSVAAANAIPGCSYNLPAGSGNVSCITAGAAYRIRGIDLGVGGKITDKWSVFGGLVLMQSEVTKSLVPSPQPLLFPTNVGLQAGQRRASIVQHVEQVPAHRRLGARRAGGLPLEDVSAERSSPQTQGTSSFRATGASIPSSRAKINKNWKVKLFVANLTNKLYYDALYQQRDAVRGRRAGPQRELVISARF